MPKQYNEDDDFDGRGVLKDGRTLRVGIQFMDSMSPLQRAIATDVTMREVRDVITNDAQVVDAFGDSGLALSKPGPRYLTGDRGVGHAVRITCEFNRREALADSIADLQDAWKTGADREVARTHNTGDERANAYMDQLDDLTTSWARGSGKR